MPVHRRRDERWPKGSRRRDIVDEDRFFSDLKEPNKMDSRPFLEFSMEKVDEHLVRELKKITKDQFDVDRILSEEWVNPSEEIVKILAGRASDGRMTQSVKEQFAQIVKWAFRELVNDRLSERLQTALEDRPDPEGSEEEEAEVVFDLARKKCRRQGYV